VSHRTSEKWQMICAVARTAQAGVTVTETRTEELPRQWMRLAGENVAPLRATRGSESLPSLFQPTLMFGAVQKQSVTSSCAARAGAERQSQFQYGLSNFGGHPRFGRSPEGAVGPYPTPLHRSPGIRSSMVQRHSVSDIETCNRK